MKKLLILGIILALVASMVMPIAVGAASTTSPTISFGITNTNGLCISVNGVTLPTVPGATITGVVWNWGDGQTMAGWMLETHTYGQSGTYTITATSTDSNGQSSTASISVQVSGTATQTTTTLTSTVNPSIYGQSITFTARVSPIPDGGIVLFQDNNTCNSSPVTVDSNGQAIYTGPYLSVGNHNIQASFSGDNNFASSTGTVTQVVNTTTAPMISLGTPNINGLGVSINGVTLPTVPGAVITGISWDWGDKSPAITGWFPQTHTYSGLGTYTVIVTSTDSNGQTQSATSTVNITSTTTQTSTTLNASYNPSYSDGPVTFTANVGPTPAGGTVQFYVDGNSVGTPVTVNSSGQANYTTSTLSLGKHTIIVSYSGYNMFSNSSGTYTEVVNAKETPTIQIWINGNINGLTVPMNGVTLPNTTVPGAVITGVVWNWGDGQTTPGWMLQTHNYSQAGTYTITATATDNYGQSQSASYQVTVSGTAIPTVNTPLFAGATSVSGTAQANATISLTVNSGTPYTTVTSSGAWTVTIQAPMSIGDIILVTAQATGQPTSLSATATVAAPLSNVANLSNLTIGGSSLSPTFNPGTYNYSGTLLNINATITPTWSQSNAAVTVNGQTVTTGNSININLPNLGPNTITVMVNMPTGTEIYTIMVTRIQGSLAYIVVTPGPSSNLAVGATQQFKAIGFYQDYSSADFTNSATWISSDTSVATISPVGFATGVATGTAYISASVSGVTSPAVGLTVGTPQTSSTSSSISTRTETLAGGIYHDVGLKSDGTVVAAGGDPLNFGVVNGVSTWTNITQVACAQYVSVGLRSDGTVVAVGDNTLGECDVASWRNIIQVAAWGQFVVGLKSNGTVVAAGNNSAGQCNVSGWTGIVQIAAEGSATIGLKYDGTVVAVGDNTYGQCNVSSWTGITQIAAGQVSAVGLKSDGTVIATGSDTYGQCDVSSWTGITQVAAGVFNTIGLRSDGTVVAAGSDAYHQCEVGSWNGIIQIGTGYYSTMGLKSDGTVVAMGRDNYGQTTGAGSWNLGCGTVTSVRENEQTSITQNDGVTVSLTPNNNAIVTVGSINNGNTSPSGIGTISLNESQFYDVQVTSNSDLGGAVATITISNSSVTADSTIQYWYNNQWNTATNISINTSASPPTISGDVPVSYLTGTPFAIGAPTLNSVAVTPNPPINLAVGSTEQFTATGTYSDNSTKDITSKVTWTSSDTTKATILSNGGLATGVAAGQTNIAAALNGTTSPAVNLTVIPASTKTSGASTTATYSTSSQAVNLTAAVTATGASVSEGTVTFTVQNGATVIGSPVTSGTVSGGNANATYTLPGGTPTGTYTILAAYNASLDFNASSDNTAQLVVNKTNTSTSGANTTATYSTSSQTVKLTATVSSTGGTVSEGTVTFTIMNGTTVVGSAVKSGIVNGSSANANYTLPGNTAIGTYNIVAAYSGGPDFNTSSNNTAILVVKKADQTFIVSFPNPSVSGSQVTFAALVVPSSLNPANMITFVNGKPVLNTGNLATITTGNLPTGSVTFFDGTSSLGIVTLDKFGFATLTISSMAVGNNSITAQYSGDANYFNSTSSAMNQVVKNNTSTALTSSLQTSLFGQGISFTATVSPSTATGTVTFKDGSKTLGTASISGGSASLIESNLTVGAHSITAVYSGDTNDAGSVSNTVSQTVSKANTTISLASSLNPAKSKNTVTFTVNVAAAVPGAGNPTGTITFKDTTTNKTLGTGVVNSSGQATCSTSSLSVTTHSIVAVYGGDTNFNGSTSNTMSQVITK